MARNDCMRQVKSSVHNGNLVVGYEATLPICICEKWTFMMKSNYLRDSRPFGQIGRFTLGELTQDFVMYDWWDDDIHATDFDGTRNGNDWCSKILISSEIRYELATVFAGVTRYGKTRRRRDRYDSVMDLIRKNYCRNRYNKNDCHISMESSRLFHIKYSNGGSRKLLVQFPVEYHYC